MQYSCDMSALIMFLLIAIILSIKLAVTLLHADRQDKDNSRFVVTAVSVDLSQNTLSFSCIMTLASVLESIVLGWYIQIDKCFQPQLLKMGKSLSQISVFRSWTVFRPHLYLTNTKCLNCNEKEGNMSLTCPVLIKHL